MKDYYTDSLHYNTFKNFESNIFPIDNQKRNKIYKLLTAGASSGG